MQYNQWLCLAVVVAPFAFSTLSVSVVKGEKAACKNETALYREGFIWFSEK